MEIETNWELTKVKLKQIFETLTDNDLMILNGKRDAMISRLESKLGKTKEEINKLISEL